jgi:hypothetical protein
MRAFCFILLVSVWLAACSQTSGTTASPDFTGVYNLISIDGNPIPYAPLHQGQQAPEIVSSTFTLNEDNTFEMTMSYKNPSGGTIDRDFSGTYTNAGADFTFKWKGAGQTRATIEGSRLTMNNEGMLFVYQK